MKRRYDDLINTILFLIFETLLLSFLIWFIIHHDTALQNLKSNIDFFIGRLIECFT